MASLKKGDKGTVEIRYTDTRLNRTVRFSSDEDRNAVFERIIENMVKLRMAME